VTEGELRRSIREMQDEKNWSVEVRETNEVIWSRGELNRTPCGFTATSYRTNGTLMRIKEYLENALRQANGELSLSANDGDGMPNGGSAAA